MAKKQKICIVVASVIAIICIALMSVLLLTGGVSITGDGMYLKAFKAAAKNADEISMEINYKNADHTLTVSQTTEYTNRTGGELTEIFFHTYANAYNIESDFPPVSLSDQATAYPNGLSDGYLNIIDQIKMDGTAGMFQYENKDKTILKVLLPTPLKEGKTAEIYIKYRITLANVAHRLGFVGNTINLGSFYPVPAVFENGEWQVHEYSSNGDPFYNEIFNFDVEIETDTPFIIAHSGTSEEKTAEATREKHITASAIRDFAIVMSTDFKVLSAKSGDAMVNYFYILDKNPEASLKAAVDSVKTFSKTFCAYPYASLAVVETPFLHGGMEYGALVYISNAVSEPAEYERVIVHEIAHQWWFGIVGNDQTRTAWIDEGLAEYSCFVFYKLNPEYKSYDAKKTIENLQNNIVAYQKIVSGVNGEFDRSMSRDINEFNTPLEYVLATYSRGMLLFYNLSEIASFEKLNSGLSSFAKTNAFKFGTRENLVKALEKSCGTKLETYFEGWVSGASA